MSHDLAPVQLLILPNQIVAADYVAIRLLQALLLVPVIIVFLRGDHLAEPGRAFLLVMHLSQKIFVVIQPERQLSEVAFVVVLDLSRLRRESLGSLTSSETS